MLSLIVLFILSMLFVDNSFSKQNIMNNELRNKFRGCLLGVLIGDCVGNAFEGKDMNNDYSKSILNNSIEVLFGDHFDPHRERNYTDDTAMTICVAQSLIENIRLNVKDLATKFVDTYFKNPDIGYGGGVVTVFEKLRQQKLEGDLYQPAKQQFNGSGSYGNGGAMRVAPFALFYYNLPVREMIKSVIDATRLTHTNELGINGALLQCFAVRKCLNLTASTKLEKERFIDELIDDIAPYEAKSNSENSNKTTDCEEKSYIQQLNQIKELLRAGNDVEIEDVINVLGNGVSALYSVPTAIYCFLRSTSPISEIETNNPIRRTVHYAISLGGDTDTIANMACSLAGAYYGDSYFSGSILHYCAASIDISPLAYKLYDLAFKTHSNIIN